MMPSELALPITVGIVVFAATVLSALLKESRSLKNLRESLRPDSSGGCPGHCSQEAFEALKKENDRNFQRIKNEFRTLNRRIDSLTLTAASEEKQNDFPESWRSFKYK